MQFRHEPIYGYRFWRVKKGQLYSLGIWSFMTGPWVPGQPQQAACIAKLFLAGKHDAPAPAEGCSCGLYAHKDPPSPQAYGSYGFLPSNSVWGVVKLWGKVIEHTKGYRAQFALPVAYIPTTHVVDAYSLLSLGSLEEWRA